MTLGVVVEASVSSWRLSAGRPSASADLIHAVETCSLRPLNLSFVAA